MLLRAYEFAVFSSRSGVNCSESTGSEDLTNVIGGFKGFVILLIYKIIHHTRSPADNSQLNLDIHRTFTGVADRNARSAASHQSQRASYVHIKVVRRTQIKQKDSQTADNLLSYCGGSLSGHVS